MKIPSLTANYEIFISFPWSQFWSICFVHLQQAYSCIWFDSYLGCPWDAPGSYSNVYIWFTSTWSVLVESTTSTISRSVSSWSHHETLSFRSWCWTSKTFIEDAKARMRIQKSPRRISLQATYVLKRFVMLLCSAQKSCWIKSWWMTSMDAHVGICYFFQALI